MEGFEANFLLRTKLTQAEKAGKFIQRNRLFRLGRNSEKARIRNRRPKNRASMPEHSIRFKVDVLSGEDIDQGTVEPRVIRTRTLDIKPLFLDEAVMQMDLLNQDFMVFRNSSTNRINVLSRRVDGNYNLIVED